MINQTDQISRTFALVQQGKDVELTMPMEISLPGEVEEFNKPEITVLEATATALGGEIFVRFTLQQDTYYIVKETALVEKISTVHYLTQLMPVEGIQPSYTVEIEADTSFQESWQSEFRGEQEQSQTILRGACTLKVGYRILSEQELRFVTPAEVDGAALAETVDVETVHSHFSEVLDLSLPVELMETPDCIIETTAQFINQQATSMCGWLKIEGEVVVEVTSQRADSTQKEKYVYPIKHYTKFAPAQADMEASVDGEVNILTWQLEENQGRLRGLLHLSGILSRVESLDATMRSYENELYAPTNYNKHHHDFEMEEVVGTGSSQTLIEQDIFFGRPVRMVREPVAAKVRHIQHEIIHNKVIVRGTLHKELFAVDAMTGSVFMHDVNEKFVHFVDVPGAAPGMRAHIDARVEFVRVEVNPDRETAHQVAIIEIRIKVLRFIKKPPHKPWPQPHKPPHYPTPMPVPPRIYIVRSGDSVWKIAQMFGVTMESIIAANNLQNPNLIYPGQKLIIPR
ncbi:MAG: LysM peptidoglycan-binding domain-containing protein [Firmicutes bacterium]|nr:LysM peptidoglycan-binding domain-containing protein [Bacillota bacterium]